VPGLAEVLGAICIAPVTLAKAGVLEGKRATVWKSEGETLKEHGADYTGASMEADGKIITADGPHSGNFQTDDIKLDYEYTQDPNAFDISGTVQFRRQKLIWTFRLDVHFADSTGAIIDTRNLVTAGSKQMIDSLSFKENLNFPPNAAYMAFSYSGTSSGTGNSGSPNDFWLTP